MDASSELFFVLDSLADQATFPSAPITADMDGLLRKIILSILVSLQRPLPTPCTMAQL